MSALEVAKDAALEALLADVAGLPAPAGDRQSALREAAASALDAQRLPTIKDEAYRFLPLGALTRTAFRWRAEAPGVTPEAIAPYCFAEADGSRLVFVNGRYAPALSSVKDLAAGLLVTTLASAAGTPAEASLGRVAGIEADVFAALNGRHATDGALVTVASDVAIARPIHLLFVATADADPLAGYPRTLVVVGRFAACTIVEDYVSLGETPTFTAPVSELVVGESAHLQHVRVQREGTAAVHIGRTAVTLERDCSYTGTALTFGAKLSRLNLDVHQAAPGTNATLNGLTFIGGEQEADTHSTLDHAHPAGHSEQVNKCVVADSAHAVFNGRVLVARGAQQTDSAQSSRNLLLSGKARVDSKPQLEIFADDVKCAHGATVGQLDTDELFYLRSRGLDEAAARVLLTYAFAADVIERLPVPSLKETLERLVMARTGRPERG